MNYYTILYNPKANNGRGKETALELKTVLKGDNLKFYDITQIKDYRTFFENLDVKNRILISGGDGTLNRFINDTSAFNITNDIYFYESGTGNDFMNDLGRKKGEPPFCINKYIKNLPEVTVAGRTQKFFNGTGFGIDGYCCERGDILREKSKKKINYTTIAIKGLLFFFKPKNAVVTVDGKKHIFKNVWLAPTMYGRYFGGGMMPTPNQDRLNQNHTVSTMVFCGKGKLRTLMLFPRIFDGSHINSTKGVHIFEGHCISVEFDKPCALQIDGETVKNVTNYSVKSFVAQNAAKNELKAEIA